MASDPSDWDPLPELGNALHPGEAVAWAVRRGATVRQAEPPAVPGAGSAQTSPPPDAGLPPGATPPSAPTTGPPTTGQHGTGQHGTGQAQGTTVQAPQAGSPPGAPPQSWRAARDARADALLTGMRQRLGSAPPAQSLVAVMRGNEQKRGRQAVAVAAMPRAPRLARGEVRAVAVPLSPAFPVDADDGDPHDARQDEPWYRALPVAEQERLSRVWDQERRGLRSAPSRRRQELLEWFWVAYVVFFLAAMPLMLVEGLAGFVRMAMAGCVTGMVWQAVPRTRFWCVTSAVVVYALVVVVPRVHELVTSPFDAVVALGSGCLVAYLAALGAMHDEMQRSSKRMV